MCCVFLYVGGRHCLTHTHTHARSQAPLTLAGRRRIRSMVALSMRCRPLTRCRRQSLGSLWSKCCWFAMQCNIERTWAQTHTRVNEVWGGRELKGSEGRSSGTIERQMDAREAHRHRNVKRHGVDSNLELGRERENKSETQRTQLEGWWLRRVLAT